MTKADIFEFFRRLVPAAEADALIASLKGLQENLGTLNDMGVQQATLRTFATDLRRRRAETETLLAMGWLLADLSAREQACRHEFAARFRAFNTKANPMRARLNAIFSSDIGHFDVPDMTEVVPEAYELVEHGLLDDNDFRDFMFDNAVRFWGEVNPDFFKGTVVEKAAAAVLTRSGARA